MSFIYFCWQKNEVGDIDIDILTFTGSKVGAVLGVLTVGTLKLGNQKSEASVQEVKTSQLRPVEVRKSLGNVHKQESITAPTVETTFAVRIQLWFLQPQSRGGFCPIQAQFCMIRDPSKFFLAWLRKLRKRWNDRNILLALPFFNKVLVIGLLHLIPCCEGQSADFGFNALLLHGAFRISWTCRSFRCIVMLHGCLLTVRQSKGKGWPWPHGQITSLWTRGRSKN